MGKQDKTSGNVTENTMKNVTGNQPFSQPIFRVLDYRMYKKKFTVGKYSLNERAGKICENFQLP